MSYVMKGKVKVVGSTVAISEKFSKREFVVVDDTNIADSTTLFLIWCNVTPNLFPSLYHNVSRLLAYSS